MLLYNILFISAIAFFVSIHFYFKEKKLLNEFIRHSRRHRYNLDLEIPIRQKLLLYLRFSMIFLCVAVVSLIQSLFKDFVEQNWKWMVVLISITVFAWLLNSRRKKQMNDALPTGVTVQQND